MRVHIVKSIFKKELTDILRDKKTIFMNVLLPIILYPVLIIVISQLMSASATSMSEKELNIAFNQMPNERVLEKIEALSEEEGQLNIVEVEDYKEAIEAKEIAAYIEVLGEEADVDYKVYMNASIDDDTEAVGRIEELLNTYKEELVEENILALGLDAKVILEPISYEVVNIAENEQMVGYLLGMILPFILITGILSGAISPAIDIMAGEKERGTLETLVTLPISNLELVMGKYLAVSLSAIVTAIMSVLSILFSMVFLVLSMEELTETSMLSFNMSELIIPLIITFICVCIFAMTMSAVSMCICALAKSFKEAQNATTPVLLVAMLLSYSSMLPNLELNNVTATIPVVNVVLLIKGVLTFRYSMTLMAIVLMSNIIFVLLAVWVLSKLFNSEEVLFGNGKGFSFLEKRHNIKKGTMPTLSDGIMIYGIAFMLMLYVGSYLQVKFGLGGLAASQLIFLGLPIVLSIYIKTDFKKVYSIEIPYLKDILGSISLWAGVLTLSMTVVSVVLFFFPENEQVIAGLEGVLYNKDYFILNLVVVALMPAICEESLFRGFIFSAFKAEHSYKCAIILSGLLFGLMHIDFIRIIPTTALGIAIAYAVYRSGSIFVGVLMHFLNNAISVFEMHDKAGWLNPLLSYIEIDFEQFEFSQLLIIVGVGILLITLGIVLLKIGRSKKEETPKRIFVN